MPDLSDARIDALLRDATMSVPYPATPSLRAGVVAAIERGRPAERVAAQPASWSRRLALGAAALVLALAFGVLALPGARTAVAEFFGIVGGQRIEILPTPDVATPASTSAASTPAPTSTAPPTPTATPFTLSEVAQPATLNESRAALRFEPGVLRGAEPEAVYMLEWGRQPLLVLQYEDFDLWQTRGAGFFGKGIPADATLEQPLVVGEPAWWIVSAGHETAFFDADGSEVLGSRRTVDRHALIWESSRGVYYRMETELPLEEALAIAETLP